MLSSVLLPTQTNWSFGEFWRMKSFGLLNEGWICSMLRFCLSVSTHLLRIVALPCFEVLWLCLGLPLCLCWNKASEDFAFVYSKDAFFRIQTEVCLPKLREGFGHVCHMFLSFCTSDHYVVDIGQHIFSELRAQNLWGHSWEWLSSVFQTFGHPDETVCSERGCETSFFFVFSLHPDLMVPGEAV